VHLPPSLVGLLAEHLEAHPFPYVFCGVRGGWLRRGAFRDRVWLPAVALLEGAEGELANGGFTFHSLRHTHKTWMAEDDVPPSLQDYRLGHIPRGVQGRYEHPTPVMVERLLARLEQRWHVAAPGGEGEDALGGAGAEPCGPVPAAAGADGAYRRAAGVVADAAAGRGRARCTGGVRVGAAGYRRAARAVG
jgi:hypothetical protein